MINEYSNIKLNLFLDSSILENGKVNLTQNKNHIVSITKVIADFILVRQIKVKVFNVMLFAIVQFICSAL